LGHDALNSDRLSKVVTTRIEQNLEWAPLEFILPSCGCSKRKRETREAGTPKLIQVRQKNLTVF